MRTLLVTADKVFKITVPDNAKITFGPWAPPKKGNTQVFQENNAHGAQVQQRAEQT